MTEITKIINPLAFPQAATDDGHTTNVPEGMTLLDYFAAKAMQSIIIKNDPSGEGKPLAYRLEDMARWAYDDALAMLKERAKRL